MGTTFTPTDPKLIVVGQVVMKKGSANKPHGTRTKYVSDKCRCEPCREANSDYQRKQGGRTVPPYVDAQAARDHVEFLSERGVGLKRVAKVSSVSHGCLWKLIHGEGGRGPSKRIRRETEEAILAVNPSDAANGANVAAGPTWELVDEMVEGGVPKVRIGEACGQTRALQLGRDFISAHNARAIRRFYQDWKLDVTDQRAEYAEEARLEQLRTHRAKYRSSPELPAPPGPTPWMTDAACRFPETPTWLFFGAELDAETTAQAKIVCECCHVRAKCLDYAIEVSAVGVWGGLSTAERDLERRRRLGRAL